MSSIEQLALFIAKTKNFFSFIVRECRNEFTIADLHNDVWVIALEIADERGSQIDLSDPGDEALVRNKLYWHRVKREEKHTRYAARLDAPLNSHDNDSLTLGEVTEAPLSQSPEQILINRETDLLSLSRLLSSYSQSTAYALTLRNFEPNLSQLAEYLGVTRFTLKLHIVSADQHKKRQDSLFDRIEKVAEDFCPRSRVFVKTQNHLKQEDMPKCDNFQLQLGIFTEMPIG